MKWLKGLFGGMTPAVPLTPAQQAAFADWQQRPAEDLSQSHFRTRYVVVDVEASGLNMVKDRLISIGAVAVREGVIDANDAFEVVLRQDEVSSHENILIHGIGGSAQREGVEPAAALLAFPQKSAPPSPRLRFRKLTRRGLRHAPTVTPRRWRSVSARSTRLCAGLSADCMP